MVSALANARIIRECRDPRAPLLDSEHEHKLVIFRLVGGGKTKQTSQDSCSFKERPKAVQRSETRELSTAADTPHKFCKAELQQKINTIVTRKRVNIKTMFSAALQHIHAGGQPTKQILCCSSREQLWSCDGGFRPCECHNYSRVTRPQSTHREPDGGEVTRSTRQSAGLSIGRI